MFQWRWYCRLMGMTYIRGHRALRMAIESMVINKIRDEGRSVSVYLSQLRHCRIESVNRTLIYMDDNMIHTSIGMVIVIGLIIIFACQAHAQRYTCRLKGKPCFRLRYIFSLSPLLWINILTILCINASLFSLLLFKCCTMFFLHSSMRCKEVLQASANRPFGKCEWLHLEPTEQTETNSA